MFEAYEIIQEEELKDINSRGTLLRHKKTGARVSIIKNDDENKVFAIAFRTPPADSTGVAHIIEHTVLCGCEKYPLKDPFVELAKGSLKTFLNAMTYPDKTVYPIASCNDTDFDNLMDVYLNSVFYPNIYKNKKIFEQEGWHYYLEKAEDPLTYNGVVYNEMKGVYSTADSVLERTVFSSLFPDTQYGEEPGGDPDYIPELTYEMFLDFHRKYYHPSNCYIYLYGDMDMEQKLEKIDRDYLSRFEKLDIDSSIQFQKPFEEPKSLKIAFPALDEEPLQDNTSLNMSIVTGEANDLLTGMAFSVLEYVLLDAPGAPLKQALLDAGIGKDVSGCYNDGILQPFLSIDAKFANEDDAERFVTTVNETLTRIAERGIDEKALRAGIHFYEFRFREADFSVYPKGLIYGLSAFETWLYDDAVPFATLKMLDIFEQLKRLIGTGYFEKLIKERIINNPHKVIVTLVPKHKLAAEKEAKLQEKLDRYKASLSAEEIEDIIKETKKLELYQNKKDSPETAAMLPMLSRSDIGRKSNLSIKTKECTKGDIRILHHDYDTRGITYLNLMFDAKNIPGGLVPYMSLLKAVLGSVSTERYNYFDLSNEINARTGGISYGIQIFPQKDGTCGKYFSIKSKYLDPECAFVFDIIREIIKTSVLNDEKKLFEIVAGRKAQLQEAIPAAGHSSAVTRALSGISESNAMNEDISGISYYRFIENLYVNFETEKTALIQTLEKLVKMIFRKENLMVSVTAEEEGLAGIMNNIEAFADNLYKDQIMKGSYSWEKRSVREAFRTSGQVQFCASAGSFTGKGYEYTGVMRILRLILNYEYLWKNIRVNGGAYGCMSAFRRSGDAYLTSYRDPNLSETYRVYDELSAYLERFDADEREMTKYIIGTISELDTPLNAKAKGAFALDCYMTGITEEMLQKERDQILNASSEDIRALAPLVRDTFDKEHICVIGSEAAVNKNSRMFDLTESLVQG